MRVGDRHCRTIWETDDGPEEIPVERRAEAPAGGVKTSRAREALEFYGADTLLLVGGSLLETGDVVQQSKAFVAEVERVSQELVG